MKTTHSAQRPSGPAKLRAMRSTFSRCRHGTTSIWLSVSEKSTTLSTNKRCRRPAEMGRKAGKWSLSLKTQAVRTLPHSSKAPGSTAGISIETNVPRPGLLTTLNWA